MTEKKRASELTTYSGDTAHGIALKVISICSRIHPYINHLRFAAGLGEESLPFGEEEKGPRGASVLQALLHCFGESAHKLLFADTRGFSNSIEAVNIVGRKYNGGSAVYMKEHKQTYIYIYG